MGVRVRELNGEADKMTKGGHTHSQKVRARQQQLNDNWEGLQRLKVAKEESLANAQRWVSYSL